MATGSFCLNMGSLSQEERQSILRDQNLQQSRQTGNQGQQSAVGAETLAGKPGEGHTDMEQEEYLAVHTGLAQHFGIPVTEIGGKSRHTLPKIVGRKNRSGYVAL